MDNDAMRTEIFTRMTERLGAVSTFFEGVGRERLDVQARFIAEAASDYVTALGEPDEVARPAADSLMHAMFGADEVPIEFWHSETGFAVARVLGYHLPEVNRTAAALILGVTRQQVSNLVRAGVLDTSGDHLTRESVRARLLRKGRGQAQWA